MSFSEETWYRAICDGCGDSAPFPECSEELAVESAVNSAGWDRTDVGQMLCGACLERRGW